MAKKRPDWRWFRERAIARKHGSLATIHPLCRDCGVELGQAVVEAKYESHCRKCEKPTHIGELISLVIFCEECSKDKRGGKVRRLNYPAQCFDCGSLLGGKLESTESDKKETQKTGDWRDYLSEARDLIKDSEE